MKPSAFLKIYCLKDQGTPNLSKMMIDQKNIDIGASKYHRPIRLFLKATVKCLFFPEEFVKTKQK
jgi:hypothetical protein